MHNRTNIVVISDLSRQDIGTRKYPGLAILLNTIKKYIIFMIIRGLFLCFKRFKAQSAKVMSPTKRSTLNWAPEGV